MSGSSQRQTSPSSGSRSVDVRVKPSVVRTRVEKLGSGSVCAITVVTPAARAISIRSAAPSVA